MEHYETLCNLGCPSDGRKFGKDRQDVHEVTLGLVEVQWIKEEFCFVKCDVDWCWMRSECSRFAMEAERVHLDEKFEFVSS